MHPKFLIYCAAPIKDPEMLCGGADGAQCVKVLLSSPMVQTSGVIGDSKSLSLFDFIFKFPPAATYSLSFSSQVEQSFSVMFKFILQVEAPGK